MRTSATVKPPYQASDLSEIVIDGGGTGAVSLINRYDGEVHAAAIVESPALISLSQRFNYDALGYGMLMRGPGMEERGPLANVRNGVVMPIHQVFYTIGKDVIEIVPLESDLEVFDANWSKLFNEFAAIVSPCFGNDYEIRMKILQYDEEWFHVDKDVIAILPLGEGRASTVLGDNLPARNNHTINKIYPPANSLVVTTPGQCHSSPVSGIPRMCVAATKFAYDL